MNDPSATSIVSLQMLLSWTLLGVLLAWMLFFAYLALRPQKAEKHDTADLSVPAGVFPTFVPHSPLQRQARSAEVVHAGTSAARAEPAPDISTAPVV